MNLVFGVALLSVIAPMALSSTQTVCVNSCNGRANGDYQSCLGCTVYATCSNEILTDNRPCPAGLVWDDNKKRCEWVSETCGNSQAQTVCVNSCNGRANGDYQSCLGCTVYVTCSNEILTNNRPCPAGLVWDDNKKRCEWTSDTCGNSQVSTQTVCVNSCNGLADGDYQSCLGCTVYATCSNEILTDNRPCPAGLVWDDNKKRCEWTSDTCGNSQVSTQTVCVNSCNGLADGDYQSCLGCTVYATCSNGILSDNRPCPAGLVWDDNKKWCEWTSDTCGNSQVSTQTVCVNSCNGLADGNYQSCLGCTVYATCSNEILTDNRPCPAGLVWDDNRKRCEWTSDTCGNSQVSTQTVCVNSCNGLADGDYQSCLGCTVYATCSNEILTDNRPCPAGLVWDDNKKRCEWTSDTCGNSQVSTQTVCVNSCNGLADGDYQSCLGCTVYATCSNEILTDNRHCPAGLVWDDNKKRCEWTSDTCGNSQVSTQTVCVNSCNGLADGDYQSCLGCTVYATCSNEILTDNRPCPAGLVWDDNKKRCEWTSDTCGNSQVSTQTVCVNSCNGLADGDYQSCLGCTVYATCSNEILTDNRPCPAGLVWDDNKKRCEWTSDTCGNSQVSTQTVCVNSCNGLADGDYQSCLGCTVYATCSNGILSDNRPCPAGLVWDDNKKWCEWTSDTCGNSQVSTQTVCVNSCNGLADGDYQSCLGCTVYATCSNEILTDNRPCPAGLVWDDNKKRCEWTSDTCGDSQVSTQTVCVNSCNGLADGDYQSCLGCTVYATCSNEILTDNRPCPAGLVWDDNKKRCEWTSDTCGNSQVSTQTVCVNSCNGLADGDYQSCLGCTVYATCSNGILSDNRPCPAGLVWDDNKKWCEWTSDTCGNSQVPASCDSNISCSSWNYQDAECPIPGKQLLSATLVNQVSSSTCTLGESYGVNNNTLWVKAGCRGVFTVCACSEITKIDCNIWGFKYAACPSHGARTVLGVKLVHQKSTLKCELGESFGIDGGSIWVDKGCRGAFDVCL